MTDDAAPNPPGLLTPPRECWLRVRRVASAARPLLLPASQWMALALAAYLGWHGYRLVDHDRLAIDRAMLWYSASLLLIAYFAWDGTRPTPLRWLAAVVEYVRAHPAELAVLAAVVGVGVFVRLFRYGTLPPHGYIILEEHIRGGVSFDILHGDRPYIYPLPNYLGALAQWIWGPTTDGIRMHDVIAGILTVPAFYLMMRECVSWRAALFATGILAGLRALGDSTVHHQSPMLLQVLMMWWMLRGLRTGNLVWYVPTAAAAAVLSYEYETSKALSLFAGAFLVFVALRALLWPLPPDAISLWRRARSFAPHAGKTVIVIAAVVLIGIGPMVAQKHRGQDIYFGSLDRQRLDRDARGTPGLIAPEWKTQLRNSIQVFTPWVDRDYHDLGSIPTRGVIDRVTSLLLWASALAGVAFFWRGYRAMFIGWFVAGVFMSSLLLSNWAAWKIMGWLPPAVALTGFLADDVLLFLRRWGAHARTTASVVMAVLVAAVVGLNMRVLNANANDDFVLREWSNTPSQLFTICDNLNRRPRDTVAFVSQRVIPQWGFGGELATADQRRAGWGDFRFVCSDLTGSAAANLQEIWPLYARTEDPHTLIQSASLHDAPRIADALARALPELGAPDVMKRSPGDGPFWTVIYDTTDGELNARQGLLLTWFDTSGKSTGSESIVPAESPVPDPPDGAATYALSGLVYADRERIASLVPAVPASDGVSIIVDDIVSYENGRAAAPRELLRGWHLVEVKGRRDGMRQWPLAWRDASGALDAIDREEMFALDDTNVWRHERRLRLPDGQEFAAQRYDFYPHIAAFDGIRIDARTSLPRGTSVLEDAYSGIWALDKAAQLEIQVLAPGQKVVLRVDGDVVAAGEQSARASDVSLGAGDHEVELVFEPLPGAVISGGEIVAYDAASEPFDLVVRPGASAP